MRTIDHNTITDAAIDQMASTPDPRLKQIMEGLVHHLHDWAREVDLTPEEWLEGIKFLTAVGHKCDQYRQEFILLSDTLGMSSLINTLHDRRATEKGTQTSLLGPFYRQDSPKMNLGDSIIKNPGKGKQVVIYGKVSDAEGNPLPNASVEIWQTDDTGHYDLQLNDPSEMDVRAHFHANEKGEYWLRTVAPLGYLIPMDGPVGDMIRAQKRHGFRPAHIHFLIGAPGYRELVTALYLEGDEHLESDTVFGSAGSLVVGIKENDPNSPIPNMPAIHFDFSLAAAKKDGSGRVGADPSQIVKTGA